MQVRRKISKRIRRVTDGLNMVADVNADVSMNVRSTRIADPRPPSRRDAGPTGREKEAR